MNVNRIGMNNLKNQLQNARMMVLSMSCPEGKCNNCPAHMKTELLVGGNPEDPTKCKLIYIMNELQKMVNLIENDQKELDELINEYVIIVRLEKEEEEKPNYFDDNDSDEGYH